MNIHDNYDEHFKYLSKFNGICLSIEEKLKLQLALNQLHHEIKCDEIWFWGKINGIENNYYVACAIFYKGVYLFPNKQFFFCNSSNFLFSELPSIKEYHLKVANKFNTYFIGNPDIILEYFDEEENNENSESKFHSADLEEDDMNIIKQRDKLKNFTEADRLSYVIRSIDNDCCLVPEGAFKMLPINEMRRNDVFKGLSSEDLMNLSKYLIFRKPFSVDKIHLIERDEAVFNFNFLDNLDDNPIKKTWSANLDSTKTVISLRNLKWPGYFAYHKANSNLYAGLYIGDGIKNDELQFMLSFY